MNELLGKIASTVRELINYDAFSILLVDHDARALRHLFSIRYDQRVNIDNVPLGKGITGAAAESREPVRVHDTAKDPRYIASHPDIRSEVAVPLMLQDRVVGVMDLESDRVGYFTDDHVRTLALLAPQVASSVENARLYQELATRERRMEEDLQAARELQRVLLPDAAPGNRGPGGRRAPAAGARHLAATSTISSSSSDGQTVIAFGDVSGKGAAAALYGGLVSGLLRTLAPRRRRPAELLRALNDALIERKVEARYVTLLVLLWDPAARPDRDGQRRRPAAHDLPRRRDPEDPRGRRSARPAGRARIRRGRVPGAARRHHRALLRRHHRSPERRRRTNTAAGVWRKWCAPTAASPPPSWSPRFSTELDKF